VVSNVETECELIVVVPIFVEGAGRSPIKVHLVVLLVILCWMIDFSFSLTLFYLFYQHSSFLPKLTVVNTSIYFTFYHGNL